MGQIVPFLAKYGFPRKICPEPEFFLICPEFGPVPPEYLQLAEDPEFRAMLVMRRAWMRSAVLDHEDARDEADKILLALRSSLEGSDTLHVSTRSCLDLVVAFGRNQPLTAPDLSGRYWEKQTLRIGFRIDHWRGAALPSRPAARVI